MCARDNFVYLFKNSQCILSYDSSSLGTGNINELISFSTRIFTKTKSQVSLVINKVRQEIWGMWLQDWLKITRSITVYTLLHKCGSRVTRSDRCYKLEI